MPTDTVAPLRYETYLLFGAPGAGKGTQGRTLGTLPRFFHLACGDVFRSLDTRTKLGEAFLKYSSKGELVPDEITIQLWRARIEDAVGAHEFKPDIDCLVLDGIPRNLNQARLMETMINVRHVFHLHCPNRTDLIKRLRKRALKDNRLDDASEVVIRRRLLKYEAEARPVLEFYGPNRVIEVNAMQPPLLVLRDILNAVALDPLAVA